MVDSAIYTSTVGAKNILQNMRLVANNLSNINTVGFRADYGTQSGHKVTSDAMNTRVIPSTTQVYSDMSQGTIQYTGRELDVAINGSGYIAVQSKTGQAGYTRAGSFEISPEGFLTTKKGELVLGVGGVIAIPPASAVSIDSKGIISARIKGDSAINTAEIGRIQLVDVPANGVAKGEDGLYYPVGGSNPVVSENVKLVPESLEGSNVDPIRCLTDLVELSRQFDMHSKHMSSIQDNASKADSLLNVQG